MSVHPLVDAFYTRIWNDGEMGAIDEIIGPDFSFRGSLGTKLLGLEEFRGYAQAIRSALADYRCEILGFATWTTPTSIGESP